MAKNDEQVKGCAVVIAILLAIGSCCNEALESCSSSRNEDTKETTEVATKHTNTSLTYETPKEQSTTQTIETLKQESSVNILDMIKTIPDDVRIIGVFQADENVYQMIYCRKNKYYMQSIFTFDKGKWGDSERLIKLSSKSYRFYEDTGEEFHLTGYSLIGYFEGAEACEWQQIM